MCSGVSREFGCVGTALSVVVSALTSSTRSSVMFTHLTSFDE